MTCSYNAGIYYVVYVVYIDFKVRAYHGYCVQCRQNLFVYYHDNNNILLQWYTAVFNSVKYCKKLIFAFYV